MSEVEEEKFENDSTGKKDSWRISLEASLKKLHRDFKAGTLSANLMRNPVYSNQIGPFGDNDSEYSLFTSSEQI